MTNEKPNTKIAIQLGDYEFQMFVLLFQLEQIEQKKQETKELITLTNTGKLGLTFSEYLSLIKTNGRYSLLRDKVKKDLIPYYN